MLIEAPPTDLGHHPSRVCCSPRSLLRLFLASSASTFVLAVFSGISFGLNIRIVVSYCPASSGPVSARCGFQTSRHVNKIAFALDTGGVSSSGGGDNVDDGDESNLGRTRLGRLVSSGARQLLEKLNSARKNFPTKIFLLLLGFYTANALATILGQTGDWDVLVAGVVVAAIEWIGILMYRKPPPLLTRRLKSFIVMVNYWKAGVCLGLFVDAFKLGS
ncbi:ycf20-like protein [Cucumis melo]|uniref:Ycf20-like protein n=1 Tax=Cucumis melo TaxID=3656 RepID=A0A1S3B8Z3_CUCME|nr:ycf20-like protein [Cucumis melo]